MEESEVREGDGCRPVDAAEPFLADWLDGIHVDCDLVGDVEDEVLEDFDSVEKLNAGGR